MSIFRNLRNRSQLRTYHCQQRRVCTSDVVYTNAAVFQACEIPQRHHGHTLLDRHHQLGVDERVWAAHGNK